MSSNISIGDSITINNKRYWQCRVCRPGHAKKYADSSTKHPIQHLRTHRLTEYGPMELSTGPGIIQQAFGNSSPKIQFNIDVFKQLLIQWMVSCHINFRQVKVLYISVYYQN